MSESDAAQTASDDGAAQRSCTKRNKCERVSIDAPDVNKVGIRVPPFSAEDPELWFAQIEGQFAISNITADSTKFYYIQGHLDPQYAKEVKDIIISPPSNHKYDKLKEELIKRLSASKENHPA